MLTTTAQQYISLFKVENATSIVIYAVCIVVTAPGEYQVSEPRIVKVTPKRQARLPGKVISPFTLSGLAQKRSYTHKTLRTTEQSVPLYKQTDILKWYSSNAPNSFAL